MLNIGAVSHVVDVEDRTLNRPAFSLSALSAESGPDSAPSHAFTAPLLQRISHPRRCFPYRVQVHPDMGYPCE